MAPLEHPDATGERARLGVVLCAAAAWWYYTLFVA